MHSEAERLAETFIRDFWAADHDIRWLDIERELAVWLDERTVVCGKRDATGLTMDGEAFFADWKTGSKGKARYMDAEKAKWRMNPQALTYAVLSGDLCRRFMVRWALKTVPAKTDFEWYTYNDAEVQFWRGELLNIADDIRRLRKRKTTVWPLNVLNCTRFGEAYACAFRDEGCYKLNFGHVPDAMHVRTEAHNKLEAEIRAKWEGDPAELVVLGATRITDWLGCNEFYRRMWEGQGLEEGGEALTIGSDFHTLIAAHLNAIKSEQENV